MASFVSYVSSFNFGAILGGSTMRYRLYSTFGLSAVEVVKIIAICTLTFVLGFCTLAGAVFTFDPLPLPEIVETKLPITTVFPIGVTLLSCVGAMMLQHAAAEAGCHTRVGILAAVAGLHAVADVDRLGRPDGRGGRAVPLLPAEIVVSYPMFLGMFSRRSSRAS